MARTYLEYVEGTSAKFWEIVVEGATFVVRYGKIGADGRTSTKSFESEEEALAEATKQIEAKRKKGYAPVGVVGELIEVDELREELGELEEIEDLLDMVETATVYRGDVVSDHETLLAFALERAEEGTLVVIDGNLTCTAPHVGWGEREDSNDVFIVKGDLSVKSLELEELGAVMVMGAMNAKNLMVSYGDNGGSLDVGRDLKADVVVATTYFMLSVQGDVDVKHILGDSTYATDFAQGRRVIDLDDDVFVEEVLEDGEASQELLMARLVRGDAIFVEGGS